MQSAVPSSQVEVFNASHALHKAGGGGEIRGEPLVLMIHMCLHT